MASAGPAVLSSIKRIAACRALRTLLADGKSRAIGALETGLRGGPEPESVGPGGLREADLEA